MTSTIPRSGEISINPCTPQEFSGRFWERELIQSALAKMKHGGDRGDVILITGSSGSGKSSFLNWIEFEIQNNMDFEKVDVIKKGFHETPGMIYSTYRDLLFDLKGHNRSKWFNKVVNNKKVIHRINQGLVLLDKLADVSGPATSPFVKAGISLSQFALPTTETEFNTLLISLSSIFSVISEELEKEDGYLIIICDNVHWSSDAELSLLRDLLRSIPPRIALVLSFQLKDEYSRKYNPLKAMLKRGYGLEIILAEMKLSEVEEFTRLRAGYNLEDPVVKNMCARLSERLGEPLSLVHYFNTIKNKNLEITPANIESTIEEALAPMESHYLELDPTWREWIKAFSILPRPISFKLTCCVLELDVKNQNRLQDDLTNNGLFIWVGNDRFDFAKPALREYVLHNKLMHDSVKHWSKTTIKCLER